MRAAVLTKAAHDRSFEVRVERLSMPKPRRNEVLVKVSACGVCHTDLHVMKGEVPFPVPAVLGHEISGEVVEVGDHSDPLLVKDIQKPGTKVVAPFILPCSTCHHCVAGHEDLCAPFFEYNRGRGQLYDGETRLFRDKQPIAMYSMGGLAEYAVVPATAVFPIPPDVPLLESCILGCAVFTAYGAVRNSARLLAGESVVVIGVGGVGGNVIQIAKAFGAYPIIAVDVTDEKLAMARNILGATHTVNAQQVSDVTATIRALTPQDKGVDVAIEALGRPDTFRQAVYSVADGGRAVMVGIAPVGVDASIGITHLVRRKIQILGSYGGRANTDMPAIIRLCDAGILDVKKSITRRYSLADASQAYHDLDAGLIQGRAIIDMSL